MTSDFQNTLKWFQSPSQDQEHDTDALKTAFYERVSGSAPEKRGNGLKFGEFLISRPSGKEAYLVFQSYMKPKNVYVNREIDFSGIKVLAPSWADEFLSSLKCDYGDRVKLLHSENASVIESLKVIDLSNG
jgi:hypothetical protein